MNSTDPKTKRDVAIAGAGPAGLFAAEIIAQRGHHVTVYERMPSPARKFLLAGRGGLNLTHSEPLPDFLDRYGVDAGHVRAAVGSFTPAQLTAWADALGAETFTGSSGRIFPRAMKASPLLRAWLGRLAQLGVTIKTRHTWRGFSESGALLFETPDEPVVEIKADAALLALGGASWPKLGSDGRWIDAFAREGLAVTPLAPANCGVLISWSEIFRSRFEGAALKRVALTSDGTTRRGEAIITREGLEGGAVYALVPAIRAELAARGTARLMIDLKPYLSHEVLAARLARPRGKDTMTNFLRKAVHLNAPAAALLREAILPDGPEALAARIKAVPLDITGVASITRAISTAGGAAWPSVDDTLMLRARPGVFLAGEMLDWEAPTGGYLLQATFATSAKAANGLLEWLQF